MKTVDITYRYEQQNADARTRPVDSAAALRRLNDGNCAFAALLEGFSGQAGGVQRIISVDPGDLGLLSDGKDPPKQRAFAAVVGCSDARVPVELIFNEGPNDLFIIRVAGNSLGTDVLGSVKYAVDHLGDSMKLIVVLGHSGCGALTAAVDVFLNPRAYLPLAAKHSLRTVIDALLVVVQAAAKKFSEAFGPDIVHRPGYREALIETSIVTNAALVAYSIQQEVDASRTTGLQIVYGVYLLDARRIWAPRADEPKGFGLTQAPRDLAGFARLGDAILRSDRISSLIEPGG